MKIKKILFFALATITLWSCSSDEDSNVLPDNFDNGAIISIANLTSNVIFDDNLEGGIDVNLEYRDSENGALLDKLDVYVSYFDRSENVGDSSNAIFGELLLRTVEETDFSNGENEFPVHNLVITTQDFLDLTNNTLDGIAPSDEFITRFEITLTDGRVFSTNNTGNNGGLISNFNIVTRVE